MAILTYDHLTRLSFSIYENKGVYALLIGSGLSRAAQIPTGWEITLDLIRRVALAQGEEEQVNWEEWYRNKTGRDPKYSELICELGLSADERRAILHGYIEPTAEDREEGRKLPTEAHYAIADLVKMGYVRVIISTNFDRLLESALRERGIEPTLVSDLDMLNGAEPLTHSDCWLFKLHGDYKDSRVLNTDEELSNYPEKYDKLLDRIFDEHGLVVCGWSSDSDHALRDAILRCPARRYSMYWATRAKPSSAAQELIDHRHGIPVGIADADTFFADIRNRVETIARTHRQNPQSIELLVNSTKRYIAKPKHRIKLDDLLNSEVQSFVAKIGAVDLLAQETCDAEDFKRKVAAYEAAIEPLARMLGVLGRWGDDRNIEREVLNAMNVILQVHNHSNMQRPRADSLDKLWHYPKVLLLTSYGIGLTKSHRWRTMHHLLSSDFESGDSATDFRRVVDNLFFPFFENEKEFMWRLIDGVCQSAPQPDDHICELFRDWGGSFIGVEQSFDLLYAKWEIISSIIFCERYERVELEDSLLSGSCPKWMHMPILRSTWKDEIRNDLFQKINTNNLRDDLLNSGVAKGNNEFLDTSISKLSFLPEQWKQTINRR